MTKNILPLCRKVKHMPEVDMKMEESLVQIYRVCKLIAPELNAKEHVSNLIFNIFAELEMDDEKVTSKKVEQRIKEHVLFAQKCVRKKRKAA
jgi:hypothetical protein